MCNFFQITHLPWKKEKQLLPETHRVTLTPMTAPSTGRSRNPTWQHCMYFWKNDYELISYNTFFLSFFVMIKICKHACCLKKKKKYRSLATIICGFSGVDNPVRGVTLNLYDLWSGNTELTKLRSKDEQLSKHFFFLSLTRAIKLFGFGWLLYGVKICSKTWKQRHPWSQKEKKRKDEMG